uniref:Uncharacterized protein n=1 Tax=uncultured SAR11 cluster alpha proteobacterium H17925_45G17 TaxID=715038 RepID=E7CA23_9PROT|nr:hypothetical protein [uncultured SAR11 cluster alpha proteobacterium H17925_45G17]
MRAPHTDMVNQQALNAEVAQQVDELRGTFNSGKTRPLEWRIEQLKCMQRMMVAEKDKM